MILDTSYLIDLFDGDHHAFRRGLALSENGVRQCVPTPVVTELAYGVESSSDSREERRRLANALRMYPVVGLDVPVARRAGNLLARADRRSGGESGVETVDAMVAAVADAYDECVLTSNVGDFVALGVVAEAY